jgi:hypothetical protein
LKYQSVKGNLTGGSSAVDLEDKFDVLIDANDQILERVVNIYTRLLFYIHIARDRLCPFVAPRVMKL